MKKIITILLSVLAIMMMLAISVGATGIDRNLSSRIIQKPDVQIDDIVDLGQGEMRVIEVGKGYFVAEYQETKLERTKCRHLKFRDVGNPYYTTTQWDSVYHKRIKWQRMKCTQCNNAIRSREVSYVLQKHNFEKNKCRNCKYEKNRK